MINDLRVAARVLRKSPGFTAVAVLTLGLGIGLVTVQGSFVYGAIFKGLPFESGERLMALDGLDRKGARGRIGLRHYLTLASGQASFDSLAAYRRGDVEVSGREVLARRYPGAEATAELFSLTGTPPALGRAVQPADNLPGAPRVLVLSRAVWKNDFGANPDIVGLAVRVSGEPATVVGVMPEGFHFPLAEQAWTNLRLPAGGPASANWSDGIAMVGRLRADKTLAQARSEIGVLMDRMAPEVPVRGRLATRIDIAPYAEHETGGPFTRMLWSLQGLVGLVLVLACVNVANLLHARMVRHRHELAVRTALGAGAGHLVRQALVLSTLLASLGAATGLILAGWAAAPLNALLTDPKKPYWVALEIDWRVVCAVVTITALVGALAGILPVWRLRRLDPLAAMRNGAKGATALTTGRSSRVLAVVQVSLATGVLLVAAVLTRGVSRAADDPYPGDSSRLLVATYTTDAPAHAPDATAETARRTAIFLDLAARAANMPGVLSAAVTSRDPVQSGFRSPLEIAGVPAVDAEQAEQFPTDWVTPDYFRVFGLTALRGRVFSDAERAGAGPVVVVNESAARRFWPGQDPIGQGVRFEGPEGRLGWHTVIGVVPDLPVDGVGRERHVPGLYAPLDLDVARRMRLHLLLRTSGDAATSVLPLRHLLHELSPDLPFRAVMTLQEAIDRHLQLIRLIGGLAFVFGISGAALAAVGIFGVTSFGVEQRRREFGVRQALGARPAQVLGFVLRQGLWQLAPGLAIGLLLGWALHRPIQSIHMFRAVAEIDPIAIVSVVTVVAGSVFLATWIPAWRAARVDPMVALRCE